MPRPCEPAEAMGGCLKALGCLFLIILVLTVLVFRSSVAWVYYEGEMRGR